MLYRWILAVVLQAGLLHAAAAAANLAGTVEDTTRSPVVGARIVVANGPDQVWAGFSDIKGAFAAAVPPGPRYRVSVERAGFHPVNAEIDAGAGAADVVLTLEPVRELTQSLEVASTTDAVAMDSTSVKRSLGAPEIANIPYPNTNDLRSALRVIPGVVRDNRGGLHVQGGAEEQTLFTLNGFMLNDPLTGRLETRFNVEAVQNVEVNSGNPAAEYGKGSTGTLAIRTQSGDDRFRYSATNFVPGFENRKGWTLADWTPRFGVSGPLMRGRAWFSNSSDIQYVKTVVEDLPRDQDRTTSIRGSNLLTGQVNLSPGHILHTGLLWSQWSAARTGLTAIDPWETTIDKRSRQWFFHAKDQIYLGGGWLIEAGYAANRTYGREVPQGHRMLAITPFGKRGNHFVDASRRASRDQVLFNAYLPAVQLVGNHQLKTGVDLDRVAYGQAVRRTGYDQFSESGVRLYRTVYAGSGALSRRNGEAAAFVQDSWRPGGNVLVEAGARIDWDSLVRRWSPSPRLGLAWSPGRKNTRLFGGFARTYDVSALRLFSRPDDQFWLTTRYLPDGSLDRGPAVNFFTHPSVRPRRPHSNSFSSGVEHHWGDLSVRADVIQRRGSQGFTYVNSLSDSGVPAPDWAVPFGARTADAAFGLTNLRRDTFRSYSLTARQILRKQYQWMASYTLSRALSNAVVDVNADDPLTALDNVGPMPWDSPHRFVSWGYLPLPRRNWAVSYLTDARTGFPFSSRNDRGEVAGGVNSRRYPAFFEVNLHLERRFQFRQHLWALRFGANNLTDRVNPDTVNNFVGSSNYLRFYGGTGRSTNFRIRWLGRAAR